MHKLANTHHCTLTTTIRLRDGELVIYKRSRSLQYQCRYKLSDGTWTRASTGKAALEHAITRACDIWHSPKTVDKMMLKLMTGNLNAKSKIRSRFQAGGS